MKKWRRELSNWVTEMSDTSVRGVEHNRNRIWKIDWTSMKNIAHFSFPGKFHINEQFGIISLRNNKGVPGK